MGDQIDDIDAMFWAIVDREGQKFHHVKGDAGGPTGAGGITLRYARNLGLDLDGDGDVDIDDIQLVTPEIAVECYRRDFYFGPKIDRLPEYIQAQMVDFGVNSGPARAVITLQKVLNEIRSVAPDVVRFDLITDGRLGKLSLSAARDAYAEMGTALGDALCDARAGYLLKIAKNGDNQEFIDGWLRRAALFRTKEPEWLPARFRAGVRR